MWLYSHGVSLYGVVDVMSMPRSEEHSVHNICLAKCSIHMEYRLYVAVHWANKNGDSYF